MYKLSAKDRFKQPQIEPQAQLPSSQDSLREKINYPILAYMTYTCIIFILAKIQFCT